MTTLQGKKVLITGAAGGIGLNLAKHFAREKSILILTDINELALKRAAEQLKETGCVVHHKVIDVSDQIAVEQTAAWIQRDLGGLDILVNNAGIGHTGEMADTTIDTWKKLIDINFLGPLYHVYAFLPHMKRQRSGHIVNVSSGQAFFRLPTWGPYATIKLALGAFSEILRFEVKKYNIKVTTVYPFMVDTGFYNDIKGETWGQKISMLLVPYYSMKPEKVGRIIFSAIKKQRPVEMVSALNQVVKRMHVIPKATDIMSTATMLFLGKRK